MGSGTLLMGNPLDQALKIRLAIFAPFPLDLLVRTPETLKWRLEEGDCFLREVVSHGKVLYEKTDGGVGGPTRLTGIRWTR